MARDAAFSEEFGDGTYRFRLAWGELANLQEACDAGPYVIHGRLTDGTWMLNDIREVIRYGLIGGGLEPSRALRLVREYVEGRPPLESLFLARAIIAAALLGAPEEKVGEHQAANRKGSRSTRSRTGKSDLPPSTETAPSSASRRKK